MDETTNFSTGTVIERKKHKKVLLVMGKNLSQLLGWNVLPVGIMYVSSSMKKAGLDVSCINLNQCGDDYLDVLTRYIKENNIEIVATGDLVVNYDSLKEILGCAKSVSEDIITIMGGGFVTHSPKEAMILVPEADYGVIGEGEITDAELVLALEEGREPSAVNGIIYRNDNDFCITEPRKEIEDLDTLPWPDYEGFKYFDVIDSRSSDNVIAAMLTTSRHCPFSCTFCCSSGGRTYRQRSLDSIFEELDYLVKKYNVKRIVLNDELFAVNEERVYEFCRRVARYDLQWVVFLRIGKHIQLPLLQEMRKAGCLAVYYGLESASNEILKSMRKQTTQEEMLRVLNITREANMMSLGGFIFGDTLESVETARYTMDWATEHANLIANIDLHPIILFPGSELYNKAVASGKIADTVKFIADYCPPMNVSERMDDDTYLRLVYQELPERLAQILYNNEINHTRELGADIAPDLKNKVYSLTFSCKNCGHKINKSISSSDVYTKIIQCDDCGTPYDFNPFLMLLQKYEKEISEFLSARKCVLWGMAHRTQLLYYSNEYFRQTNDITLLDRNPIFQAHGFHGKAVIAPENCEWDKYDTLVFGLQLVIYNDIVEKAKAINPGLKIIYLNDIIMELGV